MMDRSPMRDFITMLILLLCGVVIAIFAWTNGDQHGSETSRALAYACGFSAGHGLSEHARCVDEHINAAKHGFSP